ncbi:hypothetical protein M3A96_03125 [Helcobacillus massiliensis]|uniref:hypothetical protein n=1 Tax=Helcobacillus TaxID=1161125 RepID=UPI001EF73EB3|nr:MULTISPECIES: hypothetical protein [Helcobacillus]MCG7427302.1 hypothetical protein [Helcobacillus sp. ACRRO]MCT1557121.1 hypothetical protein [Helcobacillus massiliensis]MCT2036144.1 hypothetical protein [Helcobacillus massiliensis]MCT2331275.1 hypothetical protein [Helcobacillus massiliensis]
MTTPELSGSTPRGRMYRVEPGGKLVYPSITTVAGMRSKDSLQSWYARMAGQRALDMFAYLDRNPGRAMEEIRRVSRDRWGTQKKIAAAAEEYTQTAADFGTYVHALCEMWERSGERPSRTDMSDLATQLRGNGVLVLERNLGALLDRADVRLDGFGRFLEEFQPEFVEIEQTVLNRTVGYAGTTDAIVKIGGSVLSADIKTSKRVRGDYALQGVAVVRAENLLDNDGTIRDMPELTGAFVIHLPEAGGYQVVPLRTGDAEWEVFQSLRRSWDFLPDDCALDAAQNPKELLFSLLNAKL